jgi:hypothetical protein
MTEDPDIADIIAGTLQTSRAHAYELMSRALGGKDAEPTAQWGDPRVQAVYECLCSMEVPPAEQHWEGWTARRIVDRLATLAASSTAPHRWLFTDEHGLECVTTLDPSLWNARSRNSRTNVTPLYAAPAAEEHKPLTDEPA